MEPRALKVDLIFTVFSQNLKNALISILEISSGSPEKILLRTRFLFSLTLACSSLIRVKLIKKLCSFKSRLWKKNFELWEISSFLYQFHCAGFLFWIIIIMITILSLWHYDWAQLDVSLWWIDSFMNETKDLCIFNDRWTYYFLHNGKDKIMLNKTLSSFMR